MCICRRRTGGRLGSCHPPTRPSRCVLGGPLCGVLRPVVTSQAGPAKRLEVSEPQRVYVGDGDSGWSAGFVSSPLLSVRVGCGVPRGVGE